MKISRQVGTTSELLGVYVQDATVSTGVGLANIIGSTVNFSFIRNNQASFSTGVASTAGTTGTYSTSAWTQVHSSQAKGLYQFGVPDGLFASGGSGLLLIYGSTGVAASMAPVAIEVELTKTNNQQYASSTVFSSTNIVQSVTGTIGVSTITLSAASTITQGVNVTTGTLSISQPVGVSTITLAAASTITQGVNVTSFTGLVGVSTITLSAASTITQGVNVTSFTGLVGVSTITLAAASTITQGVNVTSFTGLVGVSTITLAAASTITQGVNTTTQTAVCGVSTLASSSFGFSTVDPGAWPLFGIIDSGVARSTVSATSFQLRSGMSATSSNTLKGATIFIYSATSGLYDRRLVTSWAGSTGVAGVDTWDETPATSASYIAFATPPGAVGGPPAVNVVQIQGSNAVTTGAGILSVSASTSISGLVGVSTITLSAASTISQGVNATTGTLSVGLVGVSTITLSAASTISQGVNVTSGAASGGLVGVSTITLGAASTITQGVNVTSGAASGGLVGVSTITLGAASTITQGVNVTSMAAAAQASLAGVILTTTQAESYRTLSGPGSVIQLMYESVAQLGEFANVGTTKTLRSVTSHAGSVATFGYDSSTSPSSITRTS